LNEKVLDRSLKPAAHIAFGYIVASPENPLFDPEQRQINAGHEWKKPLSIHVIRVHPW